MDNLLVLTLLNLYGFGKKTVSKILDELTDIPSTVDELYELISMRPSQLKKLNKITESELKRAYSSAEKIIFTSQEAGVLILNRAQPEFPKLLLDLPDVPIIYIKGRVDSLSNQPSVAIIGTREPTAYGVKAGERIAELFANAGFTIVSGLALGCDTAAHKGALKVNGRTVAVLAHGLDYIYPKQNTHLAEDILANSGCLVSEYPVGTKGLPNFFVERDRIQSGLSQAVIVIETGVKGGTMHTVRFGMEQNRRLACLAWHPSNLLKEKCVQGNYMLISDKKAFALKDSESIKEFMNTLRILNPSNSEETLTDLPQSKTINTGSTIIEHGNLCE